MSEIYLGRKDGTQTRHSEEELHTMLSSGTLDPKWLYWTKGMPDWRPVSEWIAENPPPSRFSEEEAGAAEAEEPEPTPPSPYALSTDPRQVALVLQMLLGVGIAAQSFQFLLGLWKNSILQKPPAAAAVGQVAYAVVEVFSAIAFLLLFVVTAVVFCIWIYRTKRNVFGFGAQGLRIGPGWSVGWYFVPIFSLFRPYESMKEAWQATLDPMHWEKVSPPKIVHLWWTTWVGTMLLGQISFQIKAHAYNLAQQGQETKGALLWANYMDILGALFSMAVCLVAMLLVKRLTQAQIKLVQSSVDVAQNPSTLPRLP